MTFINIKKNMILELDTEYLIKSKIDAHQYVLAKLAHLDNVNHLKYYVNGINKFSNLPNDLKKLREAGLVKEPSSEYATFDINVTDKFIKEHSFNNDPFEELYNTYPVKTIRPNGNIDYLRVDHKKSKRLYYNIIRTNRLKHDFILKCLKIEIEERKNSGQMSYMKRLPSWLSSDGWEGYADMIRTHVVTQEDKKEGDYGTNIE